MKKYEKELSHLITHYCLYSSKFIWTNSHWKKVLPKQGTLLQIQNLPDQPNDLTNSNKGLLLPRVNLTDINNLYPMFSTGYNKSVLDPIHMGLLVFNVNENLVNGKGIGIYVWDGSKWTNLDLNL